MIEDPTENARRLMIEIGLPEFDLSLAKDKWTTEEFLREFVVHNFLAPFCVCTRKSDGVKGTMEFTHMPRMYFNFIPDEPDAKRKEGTT